VQVVELLSRLSRERGVTVVSATHDHHMLAVSDRVVYLRDGRVERVLARAELDIRPGSVDGSAAPAAAPPRETV
jgi:putative ABC transport system ATP-binding protein